MVGPMSLATYEAEDVLVGHQWEEWPFCLRGLNATLLWNVRVGRQVCVCVCVWQGGTLIEAGNGADGMGLPERKPGKWIIFEI